MREVSREWLEFLREQYPKGSRVRLTKMGNDPHPIPPGSMGTLKYIDDVGQFHVKWDNGRGLALIIGEDQFQILPPEPQTIKFYMPLTAQLYAYDDWGDLEEYGNDLDGRELRDYQSCIHEALLENQMPEEKNRGLMHWYDKPDGVNTKVQSVMLDVESRDGQLWGVAECKVNGTLLPEEKEALAEYISGQASDGWGEGFEQRAIKLNDGELYCRVSTDKEEQLSSYEAQIEYYTEKIDANPDWTMVRLYADEGITGTSAKKRKDFLQMIRDCERGKIDLVITKSVSRFCRNTLDGLNYVRRLKRHGVGVYFEKENVNTLFMDNEMILTFMMSQAQAESESLSGNVKWGHRKNFKDGKVYYHCKNFLGYRWGADGQPEIDPEQAAVVRRIFSRFLLGHSVRQITTDLMTDGIKTATGKTVWHDSVIQKMLCNEKYIGDALLQKTYIADLFTREKRINNGELPKYYVHDCHPAIIDRGTFQKVQEELARRSSLKKTSSKAKTQLGKYCGKYVLSELLVCGECGSPYRRVIWTQKGVKRVVWRCQNRLEHGRKICKHSPTLDEGDIHDAVISAMNELFQTQVARNAVKASISAVLAGEEQTLSLPAVELQIRNLQERQLELFQLIVSAGADCTDYDEELRQVNMAKTKLMAKKAELEKEQRGAAAFEERLAELDAELEQSCGALTDFDELTVRQLVSNIKVLDKDSLLICFKDGTEITQAMQRRQTA